MTRIIVAVALALSVLVGGTVYAAQASLPGDALYPVKLGTEQMAMMLPGDNAARAERALEFANRRIEELEALAGEGQLQHLERIRYRYEYALNRTLARLEQANYQELMAGNATARVAEATWRHMEVLQRVYGQVPDEAKPGIERAMEASQHGYAAALGALERARNRASQEEQEEQGGPPEDVTPGPPDGAGPPAGAGSGAGPGGP